MLSPRARQKPLMPGGYTIMALGDSLTQKGWQNTVVGQEKSVAVNSGVAYLGWTVLYSGGRLALYSPITDGAPVAGTGGLTTTQIIATHLPTILQARPDFCVVLTGRNDAIASNADLAATIALRKQIYSALLAAGITPVLTSLPPQNVGSYTTGQRDYGADTKLNIWTMRYALAHRLPFADLRSPCIDPNSYNNWATGYNQDATHQAELGGRAMGKAIWDALASYVPAGLPSMLVSQQASGTGDMVISNQLDNQLFLTDTNADGIPDGWTASSGGATGNVDISLSASIGNYLRIKRSSTEYLIKSNNTIPSPAAGDLMWLGFEIRASAAPSGYVRAMVRNADSSLSIAGIVQLAQDIPDGCVFSQIFRWPSGLSSNVPAIDLGAQGGDGTELQVARFTLHNLTLGTVDAT